MTLRYNNITKAQISGKPGVGFNTQHWDSHNLQYPYRTRKPMMDFIMSQQELGIFKP